MDKLLTAEEAKLAWANGEIVLYSNNNTPWRCLNDTDFYSSIFKNAYYTFKLKPTTVLIYGNEMEKEKAFAYLSGLFDVDWEKIKGVLNETTT